MYVLTCEVPPPPVHSTGIIYFIGGALNFTEEKIYFVMHDSYIQVAIVFISILPIMGIIFMFVLFVCHPKFNINTFFFK